ncbi:AbfB domain-containing protein [Micromonospora sp. DT201]|uniref:AbfB domain-containing protein n=1 Tax=Micromonospora sp. DT201 TaxID=3393442 RepID=UPI003CF9E575
MISGGRQRHLIHRLPPSFQSYSHPDRYLRHYSYLLRLDPVTDAQGRADATFRVTS